jgi:hypothetical protein
MLSDSGLHKLESAAPPADFASAARAEGLDIDDLPVGAGLEIETGHTTYCLENLGGGKVLISGHPNYCPEPVQVSFLGSIGGSQLLTMGRIEPGLKMAFEHPSFGVIRTSRVRSIREMKQSVPS